MNPEEKIKILFQMTGSIAAFKACALISLLAKNDFDVQVVGSSNIREFIGPSTIEGLTGKPLLTDLFSSGHALDHIKLARECDLLILCPATANSINKLAAGIADDLIGSLFLANGFKKPYWIAPAMNIEMFKHPATQRSLSVLKEWGANILDTGEGDLACGEYGPGRLQEPDSIFKSINELFSDRIADQVSSKVSGQPFGSKT